VAGGIQPDGGSKALFGLGRAGATAAIWADGVGVGVAAISGAGADGGVTGVVGTAGASVTAGVGCDGVVAPFG